MYCRKCGKVLPEGVRFCIKCGTEMHEARPQEKIEEIITVKDVQEAEAEKVQSTDTETEKSGGSITAFFLCFLSVSYLALIVYASAASFTGDAAALLRYLIPNIMVCAIVWGIGRCVNHLHHIRFNQLPDLTVQNRETLAGTDDSKHRDRKNNSWIIVVIAIMLISVITAMYLNGDFTEWNKLFAAVKETGRFQTEATMEAYLPETSAEENPVSETAFQSASDTCMDGGVTVTYAACDPGRNTVTLRIENHLDLAVSPFGLPTLIINGQSVSLNPYENMGISDDDILPGTYRDITYHVDEQLLREGGAISGELFIMGPSSDKTYYIEIAAG